MKGPVSAAKSVVTTAAPMVCEKADYWAYGSVGELVGTTVNEPADYSAGPMDSYSVGQLVSLPAAVSVDSTGLCWAASRAVGRAVERAV